MILMAPKPNAKNRRYLEMHPPQAPRPAPVIVQKPVADVHAAILEDQKRERQIQAQALREIRAHHHGDVPISDMWSLLADRRMSVITTSRRVCFARG